MLVTDGVGRTCQEIYRSMKSMTNVSNIRAREHLPQPQRARSFCLASSFCHHPIRPVPETTSSLHRLRSSLSLNNHVRAEDPHIFATAGPSTSRQSYLQRALQYMVEEPSSFHRRPSHLCLPGTGMTLSRLISLDNILTHDSKSKSLVSSSRAKVLHTQRHVQKSENTGDVAITAPSSLPKAYGI